MRPNTGTMPREAKGKRIRGVLRNGYRFGFNEVASWPADTTRWSIDPPHPFDIVEWEIV